MQYTNTKPCSIQTQTQNHAVYKHKTLQYINTNAKPCSIQTQNHEWMAWGEGGGQCTCDNVRRQRTGQSASGGQQMRRQPSKQVTMCLYRAVYVIMGSYSSSCSSWCTGLPSEVTAVLDKERFTSLASLKHSTEDDIKELSLRRGLHV